MDQKQRKQAGLPYRASGDGLPAEQLDNKKRVYEFNTCPPWETARMERLLRGILGGAGENVTVNAPFRCDYGYNIRVGDNFYCNYNCVMLDVNAITIGNNVQIAPNVTLTTAGHPLHPASRASGYEYGIPIVIGDNVWLGCGVVVNPGVTIGENSVIGSGSVVTKDVPPNVLGAGNPCRVIRQITDADREFYYKDKKFDVVDY